MPTPEQDKFEQTLAKAALTSNQQARSYKTELDKLRVSLGDNSLIETQGFTSINSPDNEIVISSMDDAETGMR